MKKTIRNNKGNAQTELLILVLVMVPAFMVLPTLGKLSDVNQSVVQASRYAAWERTVYDPSEKSDAQISAEISNRFFRRQDVMIETRDDVLSIDEFGNPFWATLSDDESSQGGEEIFIRTSNESFPGIGSHLNNAIVTVGSTLGNIIPDSDWDLEQNGLYVAEVGVNTQSNYLLSGQTNCNGEESTDGEACIRRHTAILVDGWSSESSQETEERTRSLVPGGALAPVGDAVSRLGGLPLFRELRRMDGMFGEVKPDVIPADRYGD